MNRKWAIVLALLVSGLCAQNVGAVVIEDFEDVSDWGAGGGPNAGPGSITTDAGEAQVGSYAGALSYSHTAAQGFDYMDFYNDTLALNLSGAMTLDFFLKQPNDPDMFLQLQIYSLNGGFLEHNFAEGNNAWNAYSLSFATDFVDYGTGPDLSSVYLIRFRTNGDASAQPTSGKVYVDQMTYSEPVPAPATLALMSLGILGLFRLPNSLRRQQGA